MKKVTWHNAQPQETELFKPYLMQVLNYRNGSTTVTPEQALEAAAKGLDLLPSGLPRLVARFCDETIGYHYMGAAEYEFASIPSTMKVLLNGAVRASFTATDLEPSPWRTNPHFSPAAKELQKLEARKAQSPKTRARIEELKAALAAPVPDCVFYYIGSAEYVPHIPGLLRDMSRGKHRNKNGDLFSSIVDPVGSDRDYVGWLCLDYPFFLVKDQAVADRLALVFTPETT